MRLSWGLAILAYLMGLAVQRQLGRGLVSHHAGLLVGPPLLAGMAIAVSLGTIRAWMVWGIVAYGIGWTALLEHTVLPLAPAHQSDEEDRL